MPEPSLEKILAVKIPPCVLMKPFTYKQQAVCLIIRIIENIVNSRSLVSILNAISTRLQSRLLFGGNVTKGESSMFRNLSVAFIPDGNRRWYKRRRESAESGPGQPMRTPYGHEDSSTRNRTAAPNICTPDSKKVKFGADKISEVIKFAYFNNFRDVSFFCFSLKNFKRPRSEVDEIMNHIKKYNLLDYSIPIKVQVYGRLDTLDDQVRETLERYVEETQNIDGMVVNIFISYSSSEDEANPGKFDKDVDLLIRTSGEKRLSDFMVNQVARGTAVDFVSPYWPEFSLVHLWLTCFKYILEERYLRD